MNWLTSRRARERERDYTITIVLLASLRDLKSKVISMVHSAFSLASFCITWIILRERVKRNSTCFLSFSVIDSYSFFSFLFSFSSFAILVRCRLVFVNINDCTGNVTLSANDAIGKSVMMAKKSWKKKLKWKIHKFRYIKFTMHPFEYPRFLEKKKKEEFCIS